AEDLIDTLRAGLVATQRSGAIVGQLRLLGGGQGSVGASCDAAIVIERCLGSMQAMLKRNALVAVDLGPCRRVAIEEHKLTQVLVNLLRNAAEALEGSNGGRIAIALREEADQARIIVSDSGPGIPADRRATLFRPFLSSKPGGTGVGLAICAEITAA